MSTIIVRSGRYALAWLEVNGHQFGGPTSGENQAETGAQINLAENERVEFIAYSEGYNDFYTINSYVIFAFMSIVSPV